MPVGKISQSTCWHLFQDAIPTFNFFTTLHTLELWLFDETSGRNIDASGPSGLFDCVIPNLSTLILDGFAVSDPTSPNTFWRAHPGIKRLQLGRYMKGSWFNNIEVGMLPNLSYLEVIKSISLNESIWLDGSVISIALLSSFPKFRRRS